MPNVSDSTIRWFPPRGTSTSTTRPIRRGREPSWVGGCAGWTPAVAGWPDDKSPFPGLAAFEHGSHRAFFGRDAEVRALTGRLRAWGKVERGLVVVVGPSGCGKSSLVRAGLSQALIRTGNGRCCRRCAPAPSLSRRWPGRWPPPPTGSAWAGRSRSSEPSWTGRTDWPGWPTNCW